MTTPGEVLAGRYRLVRLIAAGGMGSVWEAWDELLHRRVAIKELLAQPDLDQGEAATARSRVGREARITARLHHPHAVTLYDVIDHGGQPCLILQYVPSRTLHSMLSEQGLLQVSFVTRVGAEVASALAAAHQVGIIHRDVKPSNVLITPGGDAMITDFGIAHAAGDISLTSTGMVTGTPAFLAPEVARGAASGFPADVFSLGATLYAALEGTPPFGSDHNAMAMLHKVASGQIVPPRRSEGLTSLLGHMLATDPGARPEMVVVARLLADLQSQSAATPTPSPSIAVPPRAVRKVPTEHEDDGQEFPWPTEGTFPVPPPARRSRRGPLLAMLAAAVLLVLAGSGIWLAVVGKKSPPPAADNSVAQTSSATSNSASLPAPQQLPAPTTSVPSTNSSARSTVSRPAVHAITPATSTAGPPTSARPAPSPASPAATSPTAQTPVSAATSGPAPTSGQLAAAVTDYYALMPGHTDQGWAHLTSNFQTGTAHDRGYYQRFWDSVERVTATDAHSAGPDTAQATITYFFKDGRVAVEPTVYSLARQGGILKIDSSTVLSSTTQ